MCLIRSTPIDWQMLIAQLRIGPKPDASEGKSFGQLSRATGIRRTTLHMLAKSGQPNYQNGEVLVTYWCQRMSLERDCLPKVSKALDGIASREDQSNVA